MTREQYESVVIMMEFFCVQHTIFVPFNLVEKKKLTGKERSVFIAEFGAYIYEILQDEED